MVRFLAALCAVNLLNFWVCTADNTTTFQFLKLDPCARTSALGGSFLTLGNDPNGIFTNPAIIGTVENRQISFGFSKLTLDINSGSASYGQTLGDDGSIGGSVQYINYGSFTRTDELGNTLGTFTANDLAFTVGYSNKLNDNLYYGLSGRFISSSIAGYSSTGLAADLGLLYVIPEKMWTFGFAVTNLGAQVKSYISTKESLPMSVSLGASKQLEHLPLLFNFALHDINNNDGGFSERIKSFSVGGEFTLSSIVKLRVGYNNQRRQDMKLGSTAGLAGFSIGTGINVKGYRLDYAFNSLGSIGATHVINLSTQF